MGSEDQALTVHSKRGRREKHHHQGKHCHPKGSSKLRCYTCDEIGHFARNHPMNKNGSKKKKNSKIRHDAHTAEDHDPPRKRVKLESEDCSSEQEFVMISSLTRTVPHGRKYGK